VKIRGEAQNIRFLFRTRLIFDQALISTELVLC